MNTNMSMDTGMGATQEAAAETLGFLRALQAEAVRPAEARMRLQSLRRNHPQLAIDMLSEVEAFDGSVHYDVLLRSGEGTACVSWCPERAVPWALRGVHHWKEGDLLRVNAHVMQVDAAVACLDFIWNEAATMERLVNMCVMQEELDREPIELSATDLQQAMDRFRAARGLFKAEDTRRWLDSRGMTHEKLERHAGETAIVPKLRERVTAGRVQEYFEHNRGEFDTVRVARITVAKADEAAALLQVLRSGAGDFFTVAQQLACAGATSQCLMHKPLFAAMARRDVPAAWHKPLFGAAPGDVVGPLRDEQGWSIVRVLAVQPAQWNEATQAAVAQLLFDRWLAERRAASRIEWCWGDALRTAQQDQPALQPTGTGA